LVCRRKKKNQPTHHRASLAFSLSLSLSPFTTTRQVKLDLLDDDGRLAGALRTLSFKRASVELRREGNGCPATLAIFVESEEVRKKKNTVGGEQKREKNSSLLGSSSAHLLLFLLSFLSSSLIKQQQ